MKLTETTVVATIKLSHPDTRNGKKTAVTALKNEMNSWLVENLPSTLEAIDAQVDEITFDEG